MCWAECVGVQCGGESLPVTTHVQTAKPPQSIHVLGRIEGVHVAAGGWTPWGSGVDPGTSISWGSLGNPARVRSGTLGYGPGTEPHPHVWVRPGLIEAGTR